MTILPHPAMSSRYTTTVGGTNVPAPQAFRTDMVNMPDIVRSLAMQVRWMGHLDTWYSIAEHSVLVSRIAEILQDRHAIVPALFHDAHEAYTGDCPSPHKDMIEGWREFEDGYELPVRAALGLPPLGDDIWRRVRNYDTMILHREIKVLRKVRPDWYDPEMEAMVPEEVQPVGLSWEHAEQLFKDRMADVRHLAG